MEVKLRSGIDKLLFGMKESDVKALYGEPNRKFKDEDKNVVYLYNDKKLRLTFYQDEDFRLGYMIASHPELQLVEIKLIGSDWDHISAAVKDSGIVSFEKEEFDSVENYFNEKNWIIFQVEFNEIIKVELGAIINDKDEFEWKFNK